MASYSSSEDIGRFKEEMEEGGSLGIYVDKGVWVNGGGEEQSK